MLDRSHCKIEQAAVHVIGNPSDREDFRPSNQLLDISDPRVHEILMTYFLSNFSSPEFFAFTDSSGDHMVNPVYRAAVEIFREPGLFLTQANTVARRLFDVSVHPNIKNGDLYMARFSGLRVNGESFDALGLFKSETKDSYLKLRGSSRQYKLTIESGTNVHKLDKGCLILNTEQEVGFRVCIVDTTSSIEANFWKNEFLKLRPWSDSFHHTQSFLSLAREYLVDQLQEDFNVSKADQIDLMNRSVDFFKGRDVFQKREFEAEVLADEQVIESFRKFSDVYRDQNNRDLLDNFEISAQAVKRQARIFKSVLKLDKNFHVYIHGNRELIQKGFDEVVGKHYYKIFFDEES